MPEQNRRESCPYRDPERAVDARVRDLLGRMQVEIGMATLRLDGFAAMAAGDAEGSILTKPLRFDTGRLLVNGNMESGGYIKAEVVATDRRICAGYELRSCVPVTDDSIRASIEWKGKTAVRVSGGRDCRLRFVLKNAELYSFWIDPE